MNGLQQMSNYPGQLEFEQAMFNGKPLVRHIYATVLKQQQYLRGLESEFSLATGGFGNQRVAYLMNQGHSVYYYGPSVPWFPLFVGERPQIICCVNLKFCGLENETISLVCKGCIGFPKTIIQQQEAKYFEEMSVFFPTNHRFRPEVSLELQGIRAEEIWKEGSGVLRGGLIPVREIPGPYSKEGNEWLEKGPWASLQSSLTIEVTRNFGTGESSEEKWEMPHFGRSYPWQQSLYSASNEPELGEIRVSPITIGELLSK